MLDEVLIDANHVGVTFAGSHHALAEFDLQIREGEFVSLVGPSGCGKSTFLRLVAGLQPLSSGTLTVGGASRARSGQSARQVWFFFQEATLLSW